MFTRHLFFKFFLFFLMDRLLPFPKKKFWKKKRLPSTLDKEPPPSTWNPRPSTLDKKIDTLWRWSTVTGLIIVRNYCVIVAGKPVTWSEKLSFLLELCSRSEMLSWTSVWIEFRSSSFARIDVDESFKCRTEYRILKYEHVKKYALMEWRIKATENWLYIQHLVTWSFAIAGSAKQV